MSDRRRLVDKKILIVAALFGVIGSGAYACTYLTAAAHYTFFLRISYVGMPGILLAAVLSIAVLGSHGGGSLEMLLAIATPINFILYVGLGIAVRAVWGGRRTG